MLGRKKFVGIEALSFVSPKDEQDNNFKWESAPIENDVRIDQIKKVEKSIMGSAKAKGREMVRSSMSDAKDILRNARMEVDKIAVDTIGEPLKKKGKGGVISSSLQKRVKNEKTVDKMVKNELGEGLYARPGDRTGKAPRSSAMLEKTIYENYR